MKMKIKFGNLRFSFEGELDKMIETVPSSMLNYYRDVNKLYSEYIRMSKPCSENRPDRSDTFPANGHDIYNYVARYGLANFQIQAVIQLDAHLDYSKLSRAVRISIDTQPVLGCRFVESELPYWRRLDNIDSTTFCSMEETENKDEAIQRFLESPLDMDRDPMVKIRLIRSGMNDTLCIKNNHACCDGTGTKEYLQLLSEIYSAIDQEKDIFYTKQGKRGRKDQDRLFGELGITDPEEEWIPGSEITRATWPFPWTQGQSDKTHIFVCRFSKGQLDEITRYSKARNATINDMLLTAYYRAMSEMGSPDYSEMMEIPVTVDLRRYLPDHKTEAIRNFSGSEFTKLALMPNESFEETLARIVPMMNEIKNSRPGLQSAIGLERVEKLTFTETVAYYKIVSEWPKVCGDKCAPVLSNLGVISKPVIKFGNIIVTDAYIVPPVARTPGLLLMASTYNGILTLAAGIYEGSIALENIETLLNKIKNQLVDTCTL